MSRARLRANRLPVAPPPLRHRVHSPGGVGRESSLDRVRRLAREHRAAEGLAFDPEKRGTWRGSSRDLVVNPARARRGDKHGSETDEEFLVIEDEDSGRYPFILVNPTDYNTYTRNAIFAFAFGAYGDTRLIVWEASGHLEDALEVAGEWLAEHAPGLLTSEEEIGKLVQEAQEEDPRASEEDAFETATQDMTYTESGWIPSWEWTVSEFSSGELYDEALRASKEEYESEYGEEAP